MQKLRKFGVWKIVVLLLVLAVILASIRLTAVETKKPSIYIISTQTDSQSNWINTVKLVNTLLHLNVSVYWLAEPLHISVDGTEYNFASGDFIIPFHQSVSCDNILCSTVFPQYVEELSAELNVSILNIRSNIEARAYPLNQAKVAVYYGSGVTGGCLEHLHPLEEAGFNLGIVREENLNQGNLSEYNVITFPGGGPYGKYLSQEDMDSIRDFVRCGGGYLGTCGGMVLGIEMGLLDAETAKAGQYEAYADLRGPLVLNVSQPSNPVVFGCSTSFESTYFRGPFISRVGSDVETICSYSSPTEDLSIYFPEIMKAYNWSLQTEAINGFWGAPSIISGKYEAGKVVLSTTHPEILQSSQRLFINSILYLASGEETLLKTSQHPCGVQTLNSNLPNESVGSINQTLCSQVSSLMSTLKEKSATTRGRLIGLEETNYQTAGVSAEYLTLFLDDANTRSSELLVQLDELIEVFENFTVLSNNQPSLNLLLSSTNSDLPRSLESLQERILNIYPPMLKLEDLISTIDTVEQELSEEILSLQQILDGSMSSEERFLQIINLHSSESLNLSNLKEKLAYYLLNWSFETRFILIEAHFLSFAVLSIENAAL